MGKQALKFKSVKLQDKNSYKTIHLVNMSKDSIEPPYA